MRRRLRVWQCPRATATISHCARGAYPYNLERKGRLKAEVVWFAGDDGHEGGMSGMTPRPLWPNSSDR